MIRTRRGRGRRNSFEFRHILAVLTVFERAASYLPRFRTDSGRETEILYLPSESYVKRRHVVGIDEAVEEAFVSLQRSVGAESHCGVRGILVAVVAVVSGFEFQPVVQFVGIVDLSLPWS